MQQRYCNLNGPVSIVILAAEFSHCGTNGGRDKIFFFFWCCLTPQSPWLQHLWLANGLSGWRQGGVGLRDEENNGPSAWVSTICLLLALFFSPTNLANQWQLCAVEGEYTHLLTHTHTHTRRKKEVSGGWEDCETHLKKKHCRHYCLCRCEMAKLFTVSFN